LGLVQITPVYLWGLQIMTSLFIKEDLG